MNDMTVNLDEELVRRSQKWDEGAFREVYVQTYYRMLGIVKKYVPDDAAAEKVVQDAAARIWTNFPSLDHPANYLPWADRIVEATAKEEALKRQDAPGTQEPFGRQEVLGDTETLGKQETGVKMENTAPPVVPSSEGGNEAPRRSFLKTTGGKIAVAAAAVAVAAGIGFGIYMIVKGSGGSEQGGSESSSASANASTELPVTESETVTDAITESGSTECGSTESVTERTTEPASELSTETLEPAPDYSYADIYANILQEHRDGILKYEVAPELSEKPRDVALVDVTGDDIPELFFVEQLDYNKPAMLMTYTILDGKAALMEYPEEGDYGLVNRFSLDAGGYEFDSVYAAVDRTGIYWKRTGGDATSTTRITKFTAEGSTLTDVLLDELVQYSDIGEGPMEQHNLVISEAEAANIGELIISNSGSEADVSLAFYSEEAKRYLNALKSSIEGNRGWQQIEGIWYHFSKSGVLDIGWIEDEGKWYFLSHSGEMCTGWRTIRGITYYFNEKGEMCTGEVTIDGQTYRFDENGALIE